LSLLLALSINNKQNKLLQDNTTTDDTDTHAQVLKDCSAFVLKQKNPLVGVEVSTLVRRFSHTTSTGT
jgi:hypothetical protein